MPRTPTRRDWIDQLGTQLIADALSAEDPLESLERVTRVLHERVDLVLCGLFLVAPSGDLYQDTLVGPSVYANDVGKRWPQGRGVVGRCFRAGVPVFVPDVRRDPDYMVADPAVRSELAIPFLFHGRVLGVLNLEARSRRVFLKPVRTSLVALANRIAGVIHLALLGYRLRLTSAKLAAANRRLAQTGRQLRRLATHDSLTGLANRRHFDRALEQATARASRTGEVFSLLLLDVDYFKRYNDRYGHRAGDTVLRQVAKVLRESVRRRTDLVARYGGEEFAVLLGNCTVKQAQPIAAALLRTVRALAIVHDRSSHRVVTLSGGVSESKARDAAGDVVHRADLALYAAKRGGRNRVVRRAR